MDGQNLLLDYKNNNQRNYEIAYSLYKINDTKKYKPEFKNIVGFAKKMLGYGQAMTYKMLAVGEKFIFVENDGGCQNYKNIFDADYNISQLIEMTKYKINDLMLLHVRNIISDDMKVKVIRKILKKQLS